MKDKTAKRLTRGIIRAWIPIATILVIIVTVSTASRPYFPASDEEVITALFVSSLILFGGGILAIYTIVYLIKWIIEGFKNED